MKHRENIDTISAELERSCAQEQIHLLGTVQPHGFLMVVDIASGRIVQVSSGIVRYWPGLQDAAALIGQPSGDWVEGIAASGAGSLSSLPEAYLLSMAWRPRFERSRGAAAREWECLGHQILSPVTVADTDQDGAQAVVPGAAVELSPWRKPCGWKDPMLMTVPEGRKNRGVSERL